MKTTSSRNLHGVTNGQKIEWGTWWFRQPGLFLRTAVCNVAPVCVAFLVFTCPAKATTYTLSVTSSDPDSGVPITASPTDNNGSGGGTTPFTLTYNSGTVVTLSPPATAGDNDFLLWQEDGVTFVCCGSPGCSGGTAIGAILTINGDHTMTAVYGGIAVIALSGDLAFGNLQVGARALRTLTIQSGGGYQPLHVSSISYPPGFSGPWSGTIPMCGSTNVSVTFSPTTNTSYSGTLTVNCDATAGSSNLSISGTAIIVPAPPTNAVPIDAFDTIYSFPQSGNWANGNSPQAGLVQGADGYLYGTTIFGGTYGGGGVIFRITAAGSNQTLYSFPDGTQTVAPLIQGSDGNFYGTTEFGGTKNGGAVFKITSAGTFTTLYSFTGGADGDQPVAPLIQATDGNFYGTAHGGGNGCGGTAFKLTSSGTFTLLNDFDCSKQGVGSKPLAPLVQGKDGGFYGSAECCDWTANNAGNIFRMTSSGSLTPLYSFTGGADGGYPSAGLVQATDGYLYSITSSGGAYGNGTIFRVTTNGALTTLHSFTGGLDGNPAPYGNFAVPPLIQASDGNFYGTTYSGGAFTNYGTVFQLTSNGVFTTLYSFSGGTNGANPWAGLVQGRDGNLYGTTYQGGTSGGGTIFRLVIPPAVRSVAQVGDTIGISWSSVSGQTYQVQYKIDLSQTNWMSLISAITATSSTMTTTDVMGPDNQRFYRIVMMPQAW